MTPKTSVFPSPARSPNIPLRVRKEEPVSRREGYARVTAERHFGSLFQWFREFEDVENETGLDAVRRAVKAVMLGYRNLRVSRRPRLQKLVDKGDEILAIQQLSNGKQGVLTLVEKTIRYDTTTDLAAHVHAAVAIHNFAGLKGPPLEDALPDDLRRLGQGPERLQGRSAPPHRGPRAAISSAVHDPPSSRPCVGASP